jgi:hypothetical protein
MCSTLTTPTRRADAAGVEFFLTPETDIYFPGEVTAVALIATDGYAVRCSRIGLSLRAEYLKWLGGSSTVLAVGDEVRCSCRGYHFSKTVVKECRHTRCFQLMRADIEAALVEPHPLDRAANTGEDCGYVWDE